MITRQQYLEKSRNAANKDEAYAAHREYYAQFVGSATKSRVVNGIGGDRILASTDRYMNDIPIREWDRMCAPFGETLGKFGGHWSDVGTGPIPMRVPFKAADDGFTLAGAVCVAKEAARLWKEEQNAARNSGT